MIMATYELCGVDSTQMDLSVASALRHRRSQERQVANEVLEKLSETVKEERSKIFLHFDTKQIKQDIGGEVKIVERLVIAVSSPVAERDQLLTAFPLEAGTGEAMAEAVYDILVSLDLHEYVMGIVADTTATNFGQYRGAIVVLQDFLGYPVLVIPCLHHVEELPPKHVMRLVSGRRTTGPGESIFLLYQSNFNEIRPFITNNLVLKTFNWDDHQWLENGDPHPMGELGKKVVEWGEGALRRDIFSRGDYKYSLKLLLRFLGVLLAGFKIERPKDVSPARFLQIGIFYLELAMLLNIPLVYKLFRGQEREEILWMAKFSALYYLPWMLRAKFPAKAPTIQIDAIYELRKLKKVAPAIAECALEVRLRHMELVSEENVMLAIADQSLASEEKEEMGKKLLENRDSWVPGMMVLAPVTVQQDLSTREDYWRNGRLPKLANFVGPRSFLLLDHLHWTQEDIDVFQQPFDDWEQNDKYRELCSVIRGMQVVNDTAERLIKLVKDRIPTVRSAVAASITDC